MISVGYARILGQNTLEIHGGMGEVYTAKIRDKIDIPQRGLRVFSNSGLTYLVNDPIPTVSEILDGKRSRDEIPKDGSYIDHCNVVGIIVKDFNPPIIIKPWNSPSQQQSLEDYAAIMCLHFQLGSEWEPVFRRLHNQQ